MATEARVDIARLERISQCRPMICLLEPCTRQARQNVVAERGWVERGYQDQALGTVLLGLIELLADFELAVAPRDAEAPSATFDEFRPGSARRCANAENWRIRTPIEQGVDELRSARWSEP